MSPGPGIQAGSEPGTEAVSVARAAGASSDPLVSGALAEGLSSQAEPETAAIAARLADVFGAAAVAILHYGSHTREADARPESAHDFFVVVSRYAEAYRSLAARAGTHYRPWVAAVLNRMLPPNVIAVTVPGPRGARVAKCAVLSLADLGKSCSSRARDHFVQARLIQPVQLVWTRDAAHRAAVTAAVVEARARTFDWGAAYLPARFGVETFCRTLLITTYAAEIRPEGKERAAELAGVQRDALGRMYGPLLEYLSDHGVLVRDGDLYGMHRPPGRLRRASARLYFARNKIRSTIRWLKYVALYAGWLDYVLMKVERRSGVRIELTPRERRWPLLFLWPRVIRYIARRRS